MHVVLICKGRLPVELYGGTERVVWWLGKELARLGHKVTLVADAGSSCPFADVLTLHGDRPVAEQLPASADVVHYHYRPDEVPEGLPCVITIHGNVAMPEGPDPRYIFVSGDHARRYGAERFVYNGLDPEDYGPVDWGRSRAYLHFLGKASWGVKNLRGARRIARLAGEKLAVLGGKRFSFKMGWRFTPDANATFYGMVGGHRKNDLLNGSKGLVFPVLWDEPFGLALTESMYFGCPVLGTPRGSLKEIVTSEVGFLSEDMEELADYVPEMSKIKRRRCHEYVMEGFTAKQMALGYLLYYEEAIG